MSPRPRETTDEEILAATGRVMQRLGPTQITLADVAREAGVVPATLIQRFKTKRGLLLAACRVAPDMRAAKQFAVARAKYASPIAALVEMYADCSGFSTTPEAVANGLAYLQVDLTDAEFHAITLAQFRALREETRRLLDEAVAARELFPCDTEELARLLPATPRRSDAGLGGVSRGDAGKLGPARGRGAAAALPAKVVSSAWRPFGGAFVRAFVRS